MLTILSVAYPFACVDADPAGGAEQVLAALDRAVVAAGHRSAVIACEGSAVAGALRPVPRTSRPDDAAECGRIHAAVIHAVAAAVDEFAPDVVHLHGIDFHRYLPVPGPAALATLHLPLGWYPPAALRPARPRTTLQPVSADQAARAEGDVALAPAVANGVDCDLYRPHGPKGDRLLVVGRMAPEKGFHHALDAARAADAGLDLAGQLFPYSSHRAYFADEVAPRLDDRRRWIGPIAGTAKRRLLAAARGLLIPSTVPETSSLVAMEALASGTPVIAFRSGALPSIVEHGITGFVVDDAAGMADAIGRLDAIDPAACRRAACARFPLVRTVDAYLDLYRRLAA